MLQVSALAFDYHDQPVFNNINFKLEAGCLLHLRGHNGAGKTTLLRLIAGLLQPRAGDIMCNDQSIYSNLANYQHSICYVGHKSGLSLQLTVKENCYFDLHWQRLKPDIHLLLQQYGLEHLADKYCSFLSAGQRRRVSLLRLAMTNAQIWLLDEPFVALDDVSQSLLTQCLLSHLQKGGMIILTSHQNLPGELLNCQEFHLK